LWPQGNKDNPRQPFLRMPRAEPTSAAIPP
jgi:hypothetical protein